jgi:hypothetical protein
VTGLQYLNDRINADCGKNRQQRGSNPCAQSDIRFMRKAQELTGKRVPKSLPMIVSPSNLPEQALRVI